ncbi:MAG: carnitine dehydratase [Variovorax paradoxus]|nr:MAG: carnitine dehydratase [Variovorax paradoxus]PZP99629.1 MAG: carnitine dehydratase [Variovorax paradoxus]
MKSNQATTLPRGPLNGIRVLDIGNFLAAPFCATVLAEFGAEVIKAEKPGEGDPLRRFGTMTELGDTMVWLSESRNKKCITLDLRTPRGREICLDLAARCDIVVENFRPGVLEGWSLGYEQFKAVNPDVVMVRISGYGQTGPYRGRPGFARVAHAFSGLVHLAGEPGRPPVMPGSTSLADYMAGVWGALGALMALRERDASGCGQVIDIGLYEAIFRFLDEIAPAYDTSGFIRDRLGADTINIVPHSHYGTGDDKWVAIACSNDKMFYRLAEAMQAPELITDPRYRLMGDRLARREEVNGLVSAWTRGLPADQILRACDDKGVPCSLIYSIKDIFEDPQYAARENILRMAGGRMPGFVVPNVVPKLSETPGGVAWLGPALGAHNDEIYRDLLGLSPQAIEQLRADEVI